jgi:hypothetical protein
MGRLALVLCLLGAALGAGTLISGKSGSRPSSGHDRTAQEPPIVFGMLRAERTEPTVLGEHRAKYDPEEFAMFRRTLLAAIRSRPVIHAALKRDGIMKLDVVKQHADPVAWLESDLEIDCPGDSELIRVGLSGSDPQGLAMVVNAVLDAFYEEFVVARDRSRALRVSEVEKALAEAMQTVTTKQGSLRALERTMGLRPSDSLETRLLQEQITERDRQLLRVRLALAAAKAQTEKSAAEKIRIAGLDNQEKLLREELTNLPQTVKTSSSADLLREEIARDKDVVRRLGAELEMQKVEMRAAPRVTRYQNAESSASGTATTR